LKLYNKNESREKSQQLTQRIKVVERFVEARNLEQSDQSKMVEICKELIESESAESSIRIGDV